jgi:hypothetical protein
MILRHTLIGEDIEIKESVETPNADKFVSVVIIQKVIVTVKKPLVNPMTGEMD